MSKWENEKRMVLKVGQRMVEKGLVVGTSGNVSRRLPPEKDRQLMAITPNRRDYDRLSTHDIQVVDFDGEPVEGDLVPSSETMLHIGIYRARENVNAVIHTHSVFASAISVAGLDIPPILDDQVSFLGGEIRLADYALVGSEELVENVLAALGERNAVILAHHGAVGTGRNLREAYTACELLEKTAKIYLLALALGSASTLSAEAVEVQKAFFIMLQSGSE